MPHIQPGTYAACATQAAVYDKPNGPLVLCLELAVRSDPPVRLKGYQSFTTKDGALNSRCIASLRECFPEWDGTDPFWFKDADLASQELSVVIEDEVSDRDGKTYSKVAWINPPGGRGGGAMPASGNRAAILAKYGARFRALAGGVPAKPAAAPAAAAPAPTPPGPACPAKLEERSGAPVEDDGGSEPGDEPEGGARTSDMQECWHAFCEACPHKDRATISKAWWATLKDTVPGKQQGDFTPEDWGRVMLAIEGAQLPF
jgi:hypothetical protein